MGEATKQATMMQILNALREDMRVMRQDLGDRLTRVEQRPPLQADRNIDLILNPNQHNPAPTGPNNRRDGVCINDNPKTSTRNQQTDEETGQQYAPNPNQRAGLKQDDYGEEGDEDYLHPPRDPRRKNHLFHLTVQAEQHIKKKGTQSKSQSTWSSNNINYNKPVDK
uniref:Uncharacterized protein n=1 Tax=Brassica oleracea TaxID=3712 RepID=A0A3P6DLN1_BRAOL|nr:unnamed protein product [Brassica oleracea]